MLILWSYVHRISMRYLLLLIFLKVCRTTLAHRRNGAEDVILIILYIAHELYGLHRDCYFWALFILIHAHRSYILDERTLEFTFFNHLSLGILRIRFSFTTKHQSFMDKLNYALFNFGLSFKFIQ